MTRQPTEKNTMNKKPGTAIDAQQLTRVVAIMTYVRAGSGLMSSLLDGHPNVVTTPDCVLLGYNEFWAKHGHLPGAELISSFIEYYDVLFDGSGTCKCPRLGAVTGEYLGFTHLGPNRDENVQVDREAFRRVMINVVGENDSIERKLFFQAVHMAYAEALGQRPAKAMISYGLHIGKRSSIEQHLADFPDTLFLQMIRHPVLGLGSHFRHHYLRGDMHPTLALDALNATFSRARAFPPENSSRWRAVRLEDLHHNPRETMEKVCSWLGLPWSDALLESTINGKQWWNETNTAQISGFSSVIPSQKFETYINAFDRFRLNVLLSSRSKAWGYPVHRWHRSIIARLTVLPLLLIPFKMELMSINDALFAPSNVDASDKNTRPFIVRVASAVHTIVLGREFLLRTWLRQALKKRRPEIQVL